MQFRLIPPDPTNNIHHFHPTIEIFLELNIENTLAWGAVPLQANRGGRDHTLETIYQDAGIDLIVAQNAPVVDVRTSTRLGQPYGGTSSIPTDLHGESTSSRSGRKMVSAWSLFAKL